MSKSYNRPGQQVTVTGPGGPIPVLGDMIFSSRREIERGGTFKPVPYWLSCFSTELDPRLFCEFPSVDPTEDGCLVIFDVDAFLRRALPALGPFAAAKRLIQNNYFDPYHPPPAGVNAIEAKAVGYAYQREARFVLDPEGGPPLAGGGPFFLSIGSIEDIAAVYGRDGAKTAGTGPVNDLGSAAGAEGAASPNRGGRATSDEAYLESGNPRPRPRRRRERRPRSPLRSGRSPPRSGRSPRSVRSVCTRGAASVSAGPGIAGSAISTASADSGADSWTG